MDQTQVRIDRIIGDDTLTVSIVDQTGVRAAGVLTPAQAREFAAALIDNADGIEGHRSMVWLEANDPTTVVRGGDLRPYPGSNWGKPRA